MITFPNAKINFGLRVTGKRIDGYHDIETIFYPVQFSDCLEFAVSDQKARKDILVVTGINPGTDQDDNLVIKTIKKIRERNAFPFLKIHLHKVIPVGAGLGGGSSDAACLLKTINKYFSLCIPDNRLKSLALEIGSDCPFFIDCIPSYASGRGEVLTPVKTFLNGYYLVIMNPGVGINTSEAYQNCRVGPPSKSLLKLIDYPVIEWKEIIINDFEEFAFKKHPVIGKMKDELYRSDALFSLMSGSGSSVYGIFSEKPKLPMELRNYVIWEGKL
jgi:4-diphosphocytidyl-2-C-methyl-D-erythritol kinase